MPETEAERYRRIFAATEDGLWDATELDRGPGGSLAQSPAYYSPRFLALTGYSEEQFPPRLDSFLRCIVPEDQPLLEQKVGEARSRGSRRFEVDFRIRTRSGELRWWRSATSLQLSAAGELRALSGVVRDLTEERRAADQLRRQTELLNQIQRMTRVGGWELDLVHNTLFWTEVTRQIHEVPDGFVPDLETGIRFYASESVPIITECVNRAVSRGEPFDVELDLITATGRRVPVHAIGEPVRESGKVVRVLGSFREIGEQRRREEELHAQVDLIARQQRAIVELSTPIIQVWDGVLTLPLVGFLDAQRAADLTDRLLNEVSRTRARYAILDLTGVETIDTATTERLLRIVGALRLLGAKGLLSGMGPAIAQSVVALGVDLSGLASHRTLKDALHACIAQAGR